jgi:hypothetical protein
MDSLPPPGVAWAAVSVSRLCIIRSGNGDKYREILAVIIRLVAD